MNDSFDGHGVCMNKCEIPANYIAFSVYWVLFLHLNGLILTVDIENEYC